jgi:Rho-binding antiterminator
MYGHSATMTDYIPIDCGQYSEYELAITHRQRLRVTWRDTGGQPRIDAVTPLDLLTREHQEFLIVENSAGQRFELRLDYIVNTEVL